MTETNKSYFSFTDRLKKCLSDELPGIQAHIEMVPAYRRNEAINMAHHSNAMKSSVMVLFYKKNEVQHIIFIQRTTSKGAHSGQISFPGGRWEAQDATMLDTALRETHEEIGVSPQDIEIVGKLSEIYIPPSNFLVHPYVGSLGDKLPMFTPEQSEVKSIIEVPFSFLLDPGNCRPAMVQVRNFKTEVPAFVFNGHIIWGATAMMLNELIFQWKTMGNNR